MYTPLQVHHSHTLTHTLSLTHTLTQILTPSHTLHTLPPPHTPPPPPFTESPEANWLTEGTMSGYLSKNAPGEVGNSKELTPEEQATVQVC